MFSIFQIFQYNNQSEGGDPERRHETPWARDGWGSGAGRRFFFFLRRRVRAPAGPATHPRPTHEPPPTKINVFSRTRAT